MTQMHALPDFRDTSARPSVHLVSGDLFAKCTRRKNRGLTIECRLGLWSVSMGRATKANRVAVEREARHYFAQYLAGGEYDTFLANDRDVPTSGTNGEPQ